MPRLQGAFRGLAVQGIQSPFPLQGGLGGRHARAASILGKLSDVKSSYGHRIRRGRGPSSGKGKTSGRGHKGQKQHGKVPAGFNGGQTPDEVVAGPRGFKNRFSERMSALNLDTIQSWIDQKRLPLDRSITVRDLVRSRCLHGIKDGVKLLARGAEQLRSPVKLIVSKASSAAIEAVEAQGGQVITRYYTPWALKHIIRGTMPPHQSDEFPFLESYKYHVPNPSSRKDKEYYRDPDHRGFLSHQVDEGENPSLYWGTPIVGGRRRFRPAKAAATEKTENRLW